MEFNSFAFLYFLLLVLGIYSCLQHRWQNWLLLAASYFFYGYWDSRFLALLILSTLIDFWCGRRIAVAESDSRRRFLIFSVVTNLGILGFFKYYNFFIDTFADMATRFGVEPQLLHLELILPVGISFYTFQTMSYTIDVYRGKIAPAKRLDDFALYVSFFPQLVAGPIERAGALLPQIASPRTATYQKMAEGFWLVLLGFFKKVVVADNLATYVTSYRHDISQLSGGELAVGFYIMVLFLYADFSGYSNIARGSARMLGFEISQNFKMPLFAKNPPDFWRRWHITLSDWFRDYVFQSFVNRLKHHARKPAIIAGAAFVTLVLCGLWHGAAWNFVVFGIAHGVILLCYYTLRPWMRRKGWRRLFDRGVGLLMIRIIGFHVLSLPVLFFVVPKANDWPAFFRGILFGSYDKYAFEPLSTLIVFGLPLIAIDLLQEFRKDVFAVRGLPMWGRTACYGLLFAFIVLAGATKTHEFVYFQF